MHARSNGHPAVALCLTLFALLATCGSAGGGEPPVAQVDYRAIIPAGAGSAAVSVGVTQEDGALRVLDFSPAAQQSPTASAGTLSTAGGRWRWQVPPQGGTLSFAAPLNHRRADGSSDGLITGDWGLFRGDDLVPPARTVVTRGSELTHRLRIDLPQGWSLASPYGRRPNEWLPLAPGDRLLMRPTGWFVVGAIGLRSDTLGATRVWVAGPKDQAVRFLDVLGFVRWTLPALTDVFGAAPDPLLIVSAGEPFFRGGLAAPNSFFMHAERPLISGNGTSSYAHELAHLLLPPALGPDDDWLAEGLAEFYSVESLRRSGTVSEKRYADTHRQLASWGAPVRRIDDGASSGATTARAVALLKLLDDSLRPEHSLDEVARVLAAGAALSRAALLAAIEDIAGQVPEAFSTELEQLTRP